MGRDGGAVRVCWKVMQPTRRKRQFAFFQSRCFRFHDGPRPSFEPERKAKRHARVDEPRNREMDDGNDGGKIDQGSRVTISDYDSFGTWNVGPITLFVSPLQSWARGRRGEKGPTPLAPPTTMRLKQLESQLEEAKAALHSVAREELVPYGSIVLWNSTRQSIPVGWVECDGQHGTPDLRDRFVVGAGMRFPQGEDMAKGVQHNANFTWVRSQRSLLKR